MSRPAASQSEYLRARARAAAIWRAKTEFVENCKHMALPEAKRILDEALRAAEETP